MNIIDFHSHILPGIDDGSQNTETSVQMLESLAAQGVTVIIATPHFHADKMALKSFLKNRGAAYNVIQSAAAKRGIHLIPGAEVAFFTGIGDAGGLEQLTIAGTSLLLLEMPFRAWNGSDIREVEKLLNHGLMPIIAHIERFYPYQRNKRIMDALLSLPVLVQVNSEALFNRKTKHLSLELFRRGKAQLLGSDCHNMRSRPPNLAEGRRIIEKKIGRPYLEQMDRLGAEVLKLS